MGIKAKKRERAIENVAVNLLLSKWPSFLKVGFFEFLGLGLKLLPDWLKISLQKLLGSIKSGLKAVKGQKRYYPTHRFEIVVFNAQK